jgi:cytochrome c oxidase subunit 2
LWFYNLLFGVNVVIFVIVGTVFAYVVVKFRRQEGDDTLPPQVHGNIRLEIAWTIVPTLVVIAISVPMIKSIFELDGPPPEGEDRITIEVTGKQWWWEYDYLDDGFATANEMHIEAGTWVHLKLTSADVIHAFWVPRAFGKRDATPGRSYPLTFKVDEPGTYEGQCAELCGESHALMGIKLVVHPKEGGDSYRTWVASQQAAATAPVSLQAQRGKELFVEKACTRCHSIRGDALTEADPRTRRRETGPDLTHVGSRTTLAALTIVNTRKNMTQWIYDPWSIKEGALMHDPRFNKVRVTEQEAEMLAAYLFRLK